MEEDGDKDGTGENTPIKFDVELHCSFQIRIGFRFVLRWNRQKRNCVEFYVM